MLIQPKATPAPRLQLFPLSRCSSSVRRARGSIPAVLWDTRDLSKAVLLDTASLFPSTKPEVPSENILCRFTPEHCLDSAASRASSLPRSACAHRHPQAWAPRPGCSQQQGVQQPQWLLFQWNFREFRCTDPPESSGTLVLQQDHCVMLVQQRIADVFAVSGMGWELQSWPFSCFLVQAALIIFPLFFFFFYFFEIVGGLRLYHLCALLIPHPLGMFFHCSV